MMKKFVGAAAVSAALFAAPAHAFLTNWYFQPDGTAATRTLISEYFDLGNAPSYVQTTTPVAGTFSFNEWGAAQVTGHDGTPGFVNYPFSANAINALFTISGSGTLGGTISYTGGTISVYSNSPSVYATSAGIYGANTGPLIATFSPITGGGTIDPTGIPNGTQTISAAATFLAAGYFFDPAGTDLSTLVGGAPVVFGFATTNASRVGNPNPLVVSEIVNGFAGDATFTNCLPGQLTGGCTGPGEFVISNNGQFRLIVPEPGSLALGGLVLVLAGVFARRRTAS